VRDIKVLNPNRNGQVYHVNEPYPNEHIWWIIAFAVVARPEDDGTPRLRPADRLGSLLTTGTHRPEFHKEMRYRLTPVATLSLRLCLTFGLAFLVVPPEVHAFIASPCQLGRG